MVEGIQDEKTLVQLARKGSQAAFENLYLQHHQRIYTAAVYFLGWNDSDAEDILQETFTNAWENIKKYRGDASFYTWTNQICMHLCFRRIRERQRRADQELAELEHVTTEIWKHQHQDRVDAQEQELRVMLLRKAVDRLEEPCKSLVSRRDLDGMPYAGLSEKFQIPLGTVMSRLARCRKILAKMLLKEGVL
jgi:RNA polymerase sigma-70 factor (ECF subfamily)